MPEPPPLGGPSERTGQLPDGWESVQSRSSGDTYFICTGETSYDFPQGPAHPPAAARDTGTEAQQQQQQQQEQPDLPEFWRAETSTSGDTYYVHELTGESTWELPPLA